MFATLFKFGNGWLIHFLSNGWLPPSHTQYGLIQFLTFWQDVQLFSILLGRVGRPTVLGEGGLVQYDLTSCISMHVIHDK